MGEVVPVVAVDSLLKLIELIAENFRKQHGITILLLNSTPGDIKKIKDHDKSIVVLTPNVYDMVKVHEVKVVINVSGKDLHWTDYFMMKYLCEKYCEKDTNLAYISKETRNTTAVYKTGVLSKVIVDIQASLKIKKDLETTFFNKITSMNTLFRSLQQNMQYMLDVYKTLLEGYVVSSDTMRDKVQKPYHDLVQYYQSTKSSYLKMVHSDVVKSVNLLIQENDYDYLKLGNHSNDPKFQVFSSKQKQLDFKNMLDVINHLYVFNDFRNDLNKYVFAEHSVFILFLYSYIYEEQQQPTDDIIDFFLNQPVYWITYFYAKFKELIEIEKSHAYLNYADIYFQILLMKSRPTNDLSIQKWDIAQIIQPNNTKPFDHGHVVSEIKVNRNSEQKASLAPMRMIFESFIDYYNRCIGIKRKHYIHKISVIEQNSEQQNNNQDLIELPRNHKMPIKKWTWTQKLIFGTILIFCPIVVPYFLIDVIQKSRKKSGGAPFIVDDDLKRARNNFGVLNKNKLKTKGDAKTNTNMFNKVISTKISTTTSNQANEKM